MTMGKLLVLRNDPVDGTDKHAVSGSTTSNPPTPYTGVGEYTYGGAVTSGLSDFVTIDKVPVALVGSASTLRADSKTKHQALSGSNFKPPSPPPDTATLAFAVTAGVGDGAPAATAGSSLLTIGGVKALLDGDTFDTCKIATGKGAATVAAKAQDWVTSA
jgi:uncharacterized Zn-binding protein involved in type VI secretion